MSLNNIEQAFRRLAGEGKPVLKLFQGNPAAQGIRFPADVLKEAYASFAPAVYSPDPKGFQGAREAIAAYYGGAVDPENILLTSGTSESFLHLFSLLAKPGENFLVPAPNYPLFDSIAAMTHVELTPYRLMEGKNWAIDIEEIKKKADRGTRGIILISPHNPTGSVATAEEIRDIVSFANSRELPIICDEVFSEFYFGEGAYPRAMHVAKPDLCFTLNGISKMLALPGLKLSWIVASGEQQKVRHAVEKLELSVDTYLTAHYPIQMALPRLLQEKEFIKSYREEIARRRALVLDILGSSPDLVFTPSQGGFFIMVRVKKILPISEEDFVIRLMIETGVFVHPGYFYDHEDGIYFVISYSTEPEILKDGL
ncbi:MAG: pyridoxal phosphate-dependent aminotransferase, partial [Deltaproteobacteria bacterium]|nr:pyridoxal phosphate-dependent aminotransferase [Deltaproteobacteria bacterium]